MKYKEIWQKERSCPFDHPKEADIIMENESAYVTFALAPYHKDHLLVIPKRHVEHILEMSPEEVLKIDMLLNESWEAMKEKFGYKDVSYLLREGKESGATVAHMHYHVIPEVRIGDLEHDYENREILSEKERSEEVKRMRAILK